MSEEARRYLDKAGEIAEPVASLKLEEGKAFVAAIRQLLNR